MTGHLSNEQFGEHVRKHGLNEHPWMESGGPPPRDRAHTDEEWAANDKSMAKIHEREGQKGTEAAYAAKGSTAEAQATRLNMDEVAEDIASEGYKKPMERWYSRANALDVAGAEELNKAVDAEDLEKIKNTVTFRNIAQQKLGHEAIMAPSIAGTVPHQRTW